MSMFNGANSLLGSSDYMINSNDTTTTAQAK